MMNNIFVNLFTIMTLMMPISMQTLVASTTNANETEDNSEVTLQESEHELLTLNTIMQEILVLISGNEMEEEATEIEQPVTTMETARAAVADEEPELTAEEDKALAFA